MKYSSSEMVAKKNAIGERTGRTKDNDWQDGSKSFHMAVQNRQSHQQVSIQTPGSAVDGCNQAFQGMWRTSFPLTRTSMCVRYSLRNNNDRIQTGRRVLQVWKVTKSEEILYYHRSSERRDDGPPGDSVDLLSFRG
jgi:hypothetical protein